MSVCRRGGQQFEETLGGLSLAQNKDVELGRQAVRSPHVGLLFTYLPGDGSANYLVSGPASLATQMLKCLPKGGCLDSTRLGFYETRKGKVRERSKGVRSVCKITWTGGKRRQEGTKERERVDFEAS